MTEECILNLEMNFLKVCIDDDDEDVHNNDGGDR